MNKGSHYGKAFLACVCIFVLWMVIQFYIGGGILIGIIFCSAMVGAWKAIARGGEESVAEQPSEESSETTEESSEDNKIDEQ